MDYENDTLEKKRSDAYWTYLDFCNTTDEVPRKEVYNQIKNTDDERALSRIKIWISDNQAKFSRMNKQVAKTEKIGFWSRIFKF